jgi:hypothetical protein
MNCSPTLTAEEFKVLHNTLWELGRIDDLRVQSLVERIRNDALKGAYAQDHAAFERKHDCFSLAQNAHGLRSIWSLYEVEDLEAQHPFVNAREICYRDHWGEAAVYETIQTEGQGHGTWMDLWRAADRCIRRSGDDHHIFIENFYTVADQPHQLRLTTGS